MKFGYARGELILEAFNVANEAGKTPRELADENKHLLGILEYMADKNNWEIDSESGWYCMKRPGGGGQTGVVIVSHHLNPWSWLIEFSKASVLSKTEGK